MCSYYKFIELSNSRKKHIALLTVKVRYSMDEWPMKITIQWQLNENGETENHFLTVFLQDDVWVLVRDIEPQRLVAEKEKAQSKFTFQIEAIHFILGKNNFKKKLIM